MLQEEEALKMAMKKSSNQQSEEKPPCGSFDDRSTTVRPMDQSKVTGENQHGVGQS